MKRTGQRIGEKWGLLTKGHLRTGQIIRNAGCHAANGTSVSGNVLPHASFHFPGIRTKMPLDPDMRGRAWISHGDRHGLPKPDKQHENGRRKG
jgi:hypothetical protein